MDLSTAKHAFVTGGASGIGLGIANALSARGIAVTIADANEEAIAAALSAAPGPESNCGLLRGVHLDVRDRAGWQAAKAGAEAAFGPVDILVNNAGIAPNGSLFIEMNPDSFDQIIAINLTGVFNGISAFAADMAARGNGHIVNTSSMAGMSSAVPGVGAYSAAKFGVVGMSEALRSELGPTGVGVTILCPGYIQTNLADSTRRLGGTLRELAMQMPPATVTADEVGSMVLDGIERNATFVVTHRDMWDRAAARIVPLRAAFDAPV